MAKKSEGRAKKRAKAKKARRAKTKRAKSKKKAKKMASKAKKAKSVSKRAKAKKKAAKKQKKAAKPKAKKSGIIKKAVSKAKSLIKPKISAKPNLLVTYDPNHKGTAEAEIKEVFKKIGSAVDFAASEVEGLFKLRTGDAKKAVGALVELCKSEPSLFTATHRYIPIDAWCSSGVQDMQNTIKKAVNQIGSDEKWKMSLNKRLWDKMHTTQLVLTLTDIIDKPTVDLVNPEKIVQVEIIGEEAGISVLKPNEVLDVAKIKGPMF